MNIRNRYMVDKSDRILAVYDGREASDSGKHAMMGHTPEREGLTEKREAAFFAKTLVKDIMIHQLYRTSEGMVAIPVNDLRTII